MPMFTVDFYFGDAPDENGSFEGRYLKTELEAASKEALTAQITGDLRDSGFYTFETSERASSTVSATALRYFQVTKNREPEQRTFSSLTIPTPQK